MVTATNITGRSDRYPGDGASIALVIGEIKRRILAQVDTRSIDV